LSDGIRILCLRVEGSCGQLWSVGTRKNIRDCVDTANLSIFLITSTAKF